MHGTLWFMGFRGVKLAGIVLVPTLLNKILGLGFRASGFRMLQPFSA